MALKFGDRVQETFATTGTGTLSLGGAVSGYQAFSAVLSNGDTAYYAATDGTNWEVGLGTYTSSGTTLARTTILASSNSGSAVNWAAGTKNIWLDFPAAMVGIKGDQVYTTGSGNFTVPTGATPNTRFKFTVTGGGGAGGGFSSSAGGGAGGTAIYYATGLTAGSTCAYAVGAGGSGSSGNAGGNGVDTTITVSATTVTGGKGIGGGNTVTSNGGAGGTATNGALNVAGGYGSPGNGGGLNANLGGNGGGSIWGGGSTGSSSTTGVNAVCYGSGGGAIGGATNSSGTGGNGAGGVILIEWS